MTRPVLSERAQELLVDRALRGLDDKGYWELEALGVDGDDSFDLAAAAVDLATLPIEAMPAAVSARILPVDLKQTLAGVVPHLAAKSGPLAAAAPPQRRRWNAAVSLAAAACLMLAFGAVWRITHPARATVASRAELIEHTAPIAWQAGTDALARGATGDVVWDATQQQGYMRFAGLAPNDPSQFQYQLWIFDKDRDERYPVDGGVFDVTSSGEVIVAIAAKLHVDNATLFAVTVEKPGGVVVSKRERVVLTATRS
jgi:anti-sigma-K factor RskA